MRRIRTTPLRAALAGGALVALMGASSALAAPLTYSSANVIPVPTANSQLTHPVGLVQVDLNGDGRQDVVTANQATDNTSILINNGSGTGFSGFVGPSTFGTPTAIAAADFNNDGKQDVVVADDSSTDNVFLGSGNGTFGSSTTVGDFDPFTSVAVGDLNNDGHVDIVNGDTGGFVDVMRNNGAGTFSFVNDCDVSGAGNGLGGPAITQVAIAEMNGDGFPDVVSTDGSSVYVTPGNGDGTLDCAATVVNGPYGFPINDLAVANVDGQDGPDVVVVANAGGTGGIASLLNNGDGTLTFVPSPPNFTISPSAHLAVATGDLNGDGIPDAAVSISTSNSVRTFLGNGDGTFTPDAILNTGSPAGCATRPWDVDISAFNSDTKNDIATADFGQGGTGTGSACQLGSNAVSVFLQAPASPPPPPPGFDLQVTKINNPTGSVVRNGFITYTVTVKNNGPNTATGVVLTDQVTANRVHTTGTGTSFSSSCTLNSTTATYTCPVGTLASGAQQVYTFTVRVNQTTGGAPSGSVITNTATVTPTSGDTNTANNTASVSNTVA